MKDVIKSLQWHPWETGFAPSTVVAATLAAGRAAGVQATVNVPGRSRALEVVHSRARFTIIAAIAYSEAATQSLPAFAFLPFLTSCSGRGWHQHGYYNDCTGLVVWTREVAAVLEAVEEATTIIASRKGAVLHDCCVVHRGRYTNLQCVLWSLRHVGLRWKKDGL